MKKLTILLCAVFCTICAFAQISEQDFVKFTYDNEHQFNTLNPTISGTVNYNEAASAMIMTVGGGGFGQYAGEPELLSLKGESKEFSYELTETAWGLPYYGEYYIYIGVLLLDEDGEPIETPDGEFLQAEISYSAVTDAPSKFLWTSPDGVWSGLDTFEKAYADGDGAFVFTKEVSFADVENIGTITYYPVDDDPITESISNYEALYSTLDGLFQVVFKISSADFKADDLEKIEVNLIGVKSGDTDVDTTPMVLVNSTAPKNIKRTKKGIESELINTSNAVNVYSIDGSLVKENANTDMIKQLNPGLYIIDGKKVVVR